MTRERHEPPGYPRNAWYALASSAEVEPGRRSARRALDRPVVLFRTGDGSVVALGDRDAHRPYPLSLGRVEGDTIVSGYSGFAYDRTGACVRVPSQEQVPYGARVPSYPVLRGGRAGLGLARRAVAGRAPPARGHAVAHRRRLGDLRRAVGDRGERSPAARQLRRHHPRRRRRPGHLARRFSSGVAPALEVEITETTVVFHRDWPAAPMPEWQAKLTGVGARRRRSRSARRAPSSHRACGPTAGTSWCPTGRAARRRSVSPTP